MQVHKSLLKVQFTQIEMNNVELCAEFTAQTRMALSAVCASAKA